MSQNCPVAHVMSKTRQLTGQPLVESSELDTAFLEVLRSAANRTTITSYTISRLATSLLAAKNVPGLVLI